MALASWRDLAVVLLSLEAFILLLIPAALCLVVIKGVSALQQKLSEISPKVQGVFRTVNRATRQVSDKAAEPFIAAASTSAQIRSVWRSATSQTKRQGVRS